MAARIILFDLGNVVVDWQPLKLYREIFADEAEAQAFCRDICNMDWHVRHDLGVSFADNAAPLIAKYPQYEAEIRAWRSRWLDMFHGYVPGMPELVTRLNDRGHLLYGLSNLSDEIAEETFDAFPLIRTLRDVVVSGAEKCIKPGAKIFHIALARMDHPQPSDVLFIDDREDNVQAAAALGFKTHHFTDAAGLEQACTAEGLL